MWSRRGAAFAQWQQGSASTNPAANPERKVGVEDGWKDGWVDGWMCYRQNEHKLNRQFKKWQNLIFHSLQCPLFLNITPDEMTLFCKRTEGICLKVLISGSWPHTKSTPNLMFWWRRDKISDELIPWTDQGLTRDPHWTNSEPTLYWLTLGLATTLMFPLTCAKFAPLKIFNTLEIQAAGDSPGTFECSVWSIRRSLMWTVNDARLDANQWLTVSAFNAITSSVSADDSLLCPSKNVISVTAKLDPHLREPAAGGWKHFPLEAQKKPSRASVIAPYYWPQRTRRYSYRRMIEKKIECFLMW